MLANNPQNKDFILSKWFALAQDIFGAIAFALAIFQGITLFIPAKIFLVISGVILVVEYMSSYYKSVFLIKDIALEKLDLLIIVLMRKEFQTIIASLTTVMPLYQKRK